MPVWITKKLPVSEWGAVHFRLDVAQQQMRSSLHVAMLRGPGEIGQPDNVFILLPDETLMDRFPGFSPITENDIPKGVSMLIGTETGFAKRFPEVAAKLTATALPQPTRHPVSWGGPGS